MQRDTNRLSVSLSLSLSQTICNWRESAESIDDCRRVAATADFSLDCNKCCRHGASSTTTDAESANWAPAQPASRRCRRNDDVARSRKRPSECFGAIHDWRALISGFTAERVSREGRECEQAWEVEWVQYTCCSIDLLLLILLLFWWLVFLLR